MTKYCPDCGKELINPEAEICPNCGGRLKKPPVNQKNPIIAVILSFFITGLGQLYNGQLGKGVLYFIIAVICGVLILVVIGYILLIIWWIIGMLDAYKTAQLINENEDASAFINH